MSDMLKQYTPDDIERLKDEAVKNIASENWEEIKIGAEACLELVGICGALKIPKMMVIELLEAVQDGVSELKNPWFAEQRMKECMAHMRRKGGNNIILLT